MIAAEQKACGLLSFLLRTLGGANFKYSYVLGAQKREENGLWVYKRKRKSRKGKKAWSVI